MSEHQHEQARSLHLNVNILHSGFVPSAWRLPDADPYAFSDVNHYIRIAQLAEAAKFDAVFLADNASIVEQSHGRAGWNVVTTADLASFGHDAVPDHAARYARAHEFTEVVKLLWDSWEDDAVIGDKTDGRFIDVTKVHPVAHRGAHFSVYGPLNLPRSPQGQPVLVQAGSSGDGRELAARHAEAVFSASQSLEESLVYSRDINSHAAAFGRGPHAVKILAGLATVIGATETEARQRRDQLIDLIPCSYSLNRLAGILGISADRLKLDEALPDNLALPNGGNGNHTFFNATLALARQHGQTVRQLIYALSGGGGHRVLVGTPEQIADDIEHWFRAGAADGFNLMPDALPGGLQDFVDGVVPILQQRGIFRREYSGTTLREHLGLARPASVFAQSNRSTRPPECSGGSVFRC